MPERRPDPGPQRRHRTVFGLAALMVYLLVLSGGIVCITDSSHGCPDWPVCHGRLIPPAQMDSVIEYSHRLLTPLTLPFLIAAVVIAVRRYRSERWILLPAIASIVCLLVVVVFGALVILTGLPRGWAAADLGTALMALASMVVAFSGVADRVERPGCRLRARLEGGFSRLALATTAVVYLVLVSGVLVSRPGALMRCLNWPGVVALGRPEDLFGWLYLLRFAVGAVASLLILLLAFVAWRKRGDRRNLVRETALAAVLMVVGVLVGILMPTPDNGIFMPALSMASAAGLWSVLVLVAVRSGREDGEAYPVAKKQPE